MSNKIESPKSSCNFAPHKLSRIKVNLKMNSNTTRFLQQLKVSQSIYQEHREQIDHEKVYNQLLEFMTQSFNSYQSEFLKSIGYISETRKVQELKRHDIENLSAKIRSTIKAYNLIHPVDLEDYELECLNQAVLDLNIEELKNHFRILNSLFVPIKGALLNIGITTAMLKELETKINELDIALPFNINDIESKIEKFNMAAKAIHLLEQLDIEYIQSGTEELKSNLVF